ncbi:MAG: S-layer homology domain-containing protein [Syntrophomonadaceae bacterium]|nr:S-layer homology domain-containing protein [Syntrophomonadaceae bacterium]
METDEREPQGGQKIPVTLTVKNKGPDAPGSARAVLTVTPAEAVDKIEVSSIGAGDSYSVSGNQVTINLGGLEVDIARVTGIGITTKSSYSGSLTFTSSVTAVGGTDSNSGNNTASQVITVLEQEEPEETCDVYVDNTIEETSEGQYENTITWGNKGTGTATNTKVVDTLDPKTVFVSAEPEGYVYDTEEHTVTWELSSVASGAVSTDYKVTSEPESGAASGSSLSDKVEISSDTPDADTTNNTSEKTFEGVVKIQISSSNKCYIENEFAYGVLITNNDSKTRNIKASIPIPSNAEYDTWNGCSLEAWEADSSGNVTAPNFGVISYNESTDTVTWEKSGGLQPGQSVLMYIEVIIIDWNIDGGFKLKCAATAADADSGETWKASCEHEILRPDLKVYSDTSNDGLGNYNINLEKGDAKKQVTRRVYVKNIGEGYNRGGYSSNNTAKGFKLNITLSGDNKENVKITGVTVTKYMDDRVLDYTDRVNGTIYDGYEYTAREPYTTPPGGYYAFDLQMETAAYDALILGGIDIKAEISYPWPYEDEIKADLDSSNNQSRGTINFISFNPVRSYNGFYDPGLGKYVFQLDLNYQFKSTASTRARTGMYTITQTLENITAYDSDNISCESAPVIACSESGSPSPCAWYTSTEGILSGRPAAIVTTALCDGDTLDATKKVKTEMVFFDADGGINAATYTFSYEDEVAIKEFAPLITYPENGEMFGVNPALNNTITIKGKAMPNSQVRIFNGSGQTASSPVTADAGGIFEASVRTGNIARTDGRMGVQFYAASYLQDETAKKYSKMVDLTEPYHEWCPQRTTWSAKVGGKNYTFKFREGDGGRLSTTSWEIPGALGMYSSVLKLWVGCEKPNKVWVEADGVEYNPVSVSGHYYSFNIKSAHNVAIYIECGEEETSAGPDGNAKETASVGTVLIDPDGYVFDSTQGWGQVVPGATVTCMMYDEANQAWMQWPAELYEEQVNPQTVGEDGYFAFFTPPGTYRLVVENPSPYQKWISPDLTVINEIVHQNIPYVPLPSAEASVAISVYETGLEDADEADAASITIQSGQVVEWIARVAEDATAEELGALIESPVIRIQSLLNPETDQKGFDSGLLRPGYSYRYQFDYPGTYTYYYINGSTARTGTVVVEGGTQVDTASPSAPADLLSILNGKNKVDLSWTASTDDTQVTGYQVYRRTVPDGEFAKVGYAAANSYTESGLAYETTYEYYVAAVDAAGNMSHASDSAEATTGTSSSSGGGGGGGGESSSKTASEIVKYGELEIREETDAYVRLGFASTTLQKYVDAGEDKLPIDLEDLEKKVILELDSDQLALIARNIQEVQMLTGHGKLSIPAAALPQGTGLELALGRYTGEALWPARHDHVLSRVELSTSAPFLQPVILTLEYPVSDLQKGEEVFVFTSGTGVWKPLAIDPQNRAFALAVTDSSGYAVAACRGNLTDINSHWAKRDIVLLNLKEIISGVTETSFEPDRNMTRAEFATVMVKALGLTTTPGQNRFTDVNPDAWYAGFVETACAQGILSGYGQGTFGPLDIITREQAMSTISKAMMIAGLQVDLKTGETEVLLAAYEDSEQADTWARDGIAGCVKAGIITGKNGMLAPKDKISRAEVAAIIGRLLQKTEDQ